MPKYRITSPDGGTYEVTAPDGASHDDVLAYAQQNMGKPTGSQRYAQEDAARVKENQDANPLQQFATGLKTQAGRTMLGLVEFGDNATGNQWLSPQARETLAAAQAEADLRDKGTGVSGALGNLAGDFRNYIAGGVGTKAALGANTLGQAALQSAKLGAASGLASGLTEGTGTADSSFLDNATNAGIGAALGGVIGGVTPVALQGAGMAAKKAAGMISPLQTRGMADGKAIATLSKLLPENGIDAAALRAAADQAALSGVPLDLAEMTQAKDVLALRKNIAGGFGKAASDMSKAVTTRNEQGVTTVL